MDFNLFSNYSFYLFSTLACVCINNSLLTKTHGGNSKTISKASAKPEQPVVIFTRESNDCLLFNYVCQLINTHTGLKRKTTKALSC